MGMRTVTATRIARLTRITASFYRATDAREKW